MRSKNYSRVKSRDWKKNALEGGIMMLSVLSDLSNQGLRAVGTEVFAGVQVVGSARASLWSCRRGASTTSCFIDREFNRPQVPSSVVVCCLARFSKIENERRELEKGEKTTAQPLAFNFLKSPRALRDDRGCPGKSGETSARVRVKRVLYTRVY